jgi:glycogen debranching enzyme
MQHRRITKQGPVVLATREDGSMDPSAPASQGLFLGDTRYLSRFQLRLDGRELVLLGSSEEILFESAVLQTNSDLPDIPARGIGILQKNTITEGAVDIRITLANWSPAPIDVDLSIEVDSDFFDSFEARGVKRLKRGEMARPEATKNCVELRYVGLDSVTRITNISTNPDMEKFEDQRMHFRVKLGVNERTPIELKLQLVQKAPKGTSLQPSPKITERPKPSWFDAHTFIRTSNNLIEDIIQRSTDDLEVLLIDFFGTSVPAAGLPRFAVPFGRDCLICGLQTLMWNPRVSHDVLRFLARTQGKETNEWTYEQPGKIMHEMHTGELARLKEIPFGLFYGSVDSTPLFLVLAAEYVRWTGDLGLYHDLKSNLDAAWKWIDDYGDIDGSGYIQYQARTPPKMSAAALTVGLFNQGWKDSANSVVYSNGEVVTDHPIALAEVQGELYRALAMWAEVYDAMPESEGNRGRAAEFRTRAARLKDKFNRDFWMDDKQYYAMALDGHHRPVDSITSNPGECLWARMIDVDHVDAVAKTLLSDSMSTSWGVRTMASSENAYNPFSYHNGSVWPFENSLIASGLKKYGLVEETQEIIESMLDAALYFEYRRWPEVYCGVSKTTGGVLARQPDASRPQAWSAGAIFLLLQTILGIAPVAFSKRIDLTPALPTCVDEIDVDNLSIAGGVLGLRLVRENNAVLMEIKHNPNQLDLVIHPAYQERGPRHGDDLPAVSQ